MNNKIVKKLEEKLFNQEEIKELEKTENRYKTLNIKECIQEKKRLFFIIILLIVVNIFVLVILFSVDKLRAYYVIDDTGRVLQLQKVAGPIRTRDSLYSFLDDTIILTFDLKFDDWRETIFRVKNRYSDETFNKLLAEMKRSKFLELLENLHRVVRIVPTNTIYNITPVGPSSYDVYRSYYLETIGDDGTIRKEVVFKARINIITPTKRYYQGLVITSLHQMSLESYRNSVVSGR